MQPNHPSRTAFRVAVARAAHQVLEIPKIFDDPIALKVVGAQNPEQFRSNRQFATWRSRYLRAFVVARSRFAEDELARAIANGVRQYVVLGAGLDTFAYRNPWPGLRIFEVDYPATQGWKRKLLDTARIPIPDSLTFVPIDFETQTLADRLREAGLRIDKPVFFSWLGVVMYLSEETIMTTMKYVASCAPGSGIVCDFMTPPTSLGFVRRIFFWMWARRVAALGEPWRTFFDPAAFVAKLKSVGFSCVTDVTPDEINARYFSNRHDEFAIGKVGRLVSAWR